VAASSVTQVSLGCQEQAHMKLTGLAFKAVANSKHGSLNTETIMRFTSDEPVIVGNYSGGTIVTGHVLAKLLSESWEGQLRRATKITCRPPRFSARAETRWTSAVKPHRRRRRRNGASSSADQTASTPPGVRAAWIVARPRSR